MPRLRPWLCALLLIGLAACTAAGTTPTPLSPTATVPVLLPTDTPASQPTIPPPTATPLPPTALPTAFPTAQAGVRFAVIGDYGQAGPEEEAVAALVHSWAPDFIVTAGDNNYPRGKADTIDRNIGQYYHDFIAPYFGDYGPGAAVNRFFPALGNHDWGYGDIQPYLDYFTLPGNERYYDLRQGPVHLFFLDSDSREPDGIGRSSRQAAWLQAALAASDAPWRIVIVHHPPYSSAEHGNNRALQWPFADWGAQIVISGHDHTYERIQRDGVLYFVNGLGGHPARYGFGEPVEGSQVRFRETHGAMLVTATPEEITLQFITVDGQVIDQITLANR